MLENELYYLGFLDLLEGEKDVKKFTADFETSTLKWNEKETWVWAWATCEIGTEELKMGNSIDTFIEFCKKQKNAIFYFHNLKFDSEFLIYYLLTHGFEHVEKREDIKDNTFTTLISDMGVFYSVTVYFEKKNKKVKKATFFDSLKIIPFSVEQIAYSFNLPINKLTLDYDIPRKIGHELTKEEIEYIKNDVLIVAKALKVLFDEKLDRMTEGSNALHDFKKDFKQSKWERYFPELDKTLDEELRKSYKGGFTYLSPEFKEKEVENVTILDVNSLYPSVMFNSPMPIGEPIYFEGKYEDDKIFPLYIQTFSCSFEIKKNKIPTIQIKNSMSFIANEYLTSSNNEIVVLTLTNVDLKLFFEQYNVYDIEYICGWKFKSMTGIFTDYINKWITRKNEATLTKNKGQRTLAKLMLNSLYGKFATSLKAQSKNPYLNEEGIVKYSLGEEEEKKGLYIPIGSFVTAWARNKTIRTSQAIMDYSINKYGQNKYIYSDTDSIHTLLSIDELKQFCEIDDIKLGAWKHEGTARKGKFIRQKCYIEDFEDSGISITCAGMPKKCVYKKEGKEGLFYKTIGGKEKKFNIKDFKQGFSCGGKLTFKHIKGGVVLEETEFTIKEEKLIKAVNNISNSRKL